MSPVGRRRGSARARAFAVFLLTLVLGAGALGFVTLRFLRYPDQATGSASGPVELTIPRGASAGEVARRLAEAGLLAEARWFRLYAGQRGVAGQFKAGNYRIEAPATPRQLVDLLVKGVADELVTVTLPEGKNLLEVSELLAAAGVAERDALIARAIDAAFAAELGVPGKTLEGYLFPDTYKLRPGTPPERVLLTLVRRHREVWAALRAEHAAGAERLRERLGWGDHEIVTLASIVEKETGQPEERPRIAQVFLNRLLFDAFQPKLLQTDPTIIYGCTVAPRFLGKASEACARFTDRIRRIHLEDRDNPYSTYAHPGLPPGPIANPGRAALAAVLAPDGTKYLYFVSRNDGTHQFSATRAEHDAAVNRYQRGVVAPN